MLRSWTMGWLARLIAALGAMALSGCTSTRPSCIDPTGEHIFAGSPPVATAGAAAAPADQPYVESPSGPFNYDVVETLLQPKEMVVPVGSEVVLVAGVAGGDGYLRTNRRLEWAITPGSVGSFVAVQEGAFVDVLVGDFTRPRIVTNTFAIGSTSRSYVRLTRGTPNPEDDVNVMRGQGWASLTSPVEGTSNVTVVAPDVYDWQARTKTATVHWVDAQPRFPPPAINPAGTKHVFTTTVTRRSNQCPHEGWRVRYEIVGGPPAGFSPDGSPVIEVPTNAAGQASAEIFQKQPAHGTNKVCIQVIRPGDMPGANGRRLVVDTATTMKTWTAADLAIDTTGPVTASVGGPLVYRIDVTNPGDLPAKDIVVTNVLPDGLTFLGSNPPAENAGRQLQWRLGELGARQRRTIEAQFRAERAGIVTNCCDASAAGGLKVSDCATTTVGGPAGSAPSGVGTPGIGGPSPGITPPSTGTGQPAGTLELRVDGPAQQQVPVGSRVTFQLVLNNRGTRTLTGLRIKVRLDPGLTHPNADPQKGLENVLGDVPPGVSRVNITLGVTQPGRLCQNIEVSGKDVPPISARACILAVAGGATPRVGQPGVGTQPGSETPPSSRPMQPPVTVQKIGPKQPLVVGDTARFTMEVANRGSVDLRNVKILDRSDPALTPSLATDGYRVENEALAWVVDLPAGRSTRLEVHCICQAAGSTCNRVTVILPDGGRVEDQACLEVRPAATAPPPARTEPPPSRTELPRSQMEPPPARTEPPAFGTPGQPPVTPPSTATSADGLSLSVVGLRNPVAVNKELSYEIRVTNAGTAAAQQINLVATIPSGMTVVPLGTIGPESSKFSVNGQVIRFSPIAELRPGESLTYRVRVLAKQAGQYRFKAELASPDVTQPVVQEAATEVF